MSTGEPSSRTAFTQPSTDLSPRANSDSDRSAQQAPPKQANYAPDGLPSSDHPAETILDIEKLLNAAGSLIVVFNRQGKIKRFNRACETVTGYLESEVQDHCAWDFLLSPNERVAMRGIFSQLIDGQTNRYYESTWIGKDSVRHVIAWSNTVITNPLGRVDFVVASGIDVTEQHHSRRQLERQYRHSHLLVEITQKVRQSLEVEDILQTTVTEVQGLLGCDRAFILKATAGEPIELAAESLTDLAQGPAQSILRRPWPDNPLLHANYVDHYRQQSISVIDTVCGLGTAPEIVDILQRLGVKSELAVPILTHGHSEDIAEETFWGLLIAHQCTQTRRWTPLEIDLMQQLANQIGVAINHAELLDHLEDIVVERTAELTATNQQLRREMEERQRTASALRHSEKQLRLITNALPALVAYIDSHHRYRFNNYAYELWYDIPYQQIKGRQVSDIVSLGVYQQMLPYLEQALMGEKVTYEAEMVQSSGERLWASVSYIPDMRDGQVQGLFSLVSDISDRKATERMKDEFVSVVSHELRTPLTSVHGSLKLLATGRLGTLTEQGEDLLAIALQNTERLTRLLNDVLDLERMSSGHATFTPTICAVPDMLQSAADAMQAMADEYNIVLKIKIHPAKANFPTGRAEVSAQTTSPTAEQPFNVWADPDQVMQALTNLLSNAIKFSPRGETVWLTARKLDQKVEFSVKDFGRGIPSDKLETIFERFQQVDTSDARERGGTGLGLAICREIIQQHQGRIWVKSIHGKGSSFYFTLPMPESPRQTANE
ncbi:MAG: ATP-binding protein [Cyanobacteria bacterium J06614_10]